MSGLIPDTGRWRAATVGAAAALVVLVVVSYLPALSCGYVWDDDRLLTNNPNMLSFDGLVRTWIDPRANTDFYPLSHTSWWLEYRIWDVRPLGYHLDNILLHALNALLVWRILRRLAVPGAWVAAAIFALHPVQVEAVAWVSERKSVLGGLLCLSAVWLFVRAYVTGDDLPARRRRLLYGLSLACYAAALLARPVMMASAGVLPLLLWWKHGRLTRWDLLRVGGYLLLAAPMAALTIWVQYTVVGATGEEFDYSALERLLIAGRVLAFYVGKLFCPIDLTFSYDKWAIDAGVWWQYLFPAGAAAVLAALALLRRWLGWGPLAAALLFVVLLSPALGFINVYWHRYYFVADHMQYLACLGVIGLAVAGAAALTSRLGSWGRPVAAVTAAIMLAVLGTLTWLQCGIYKDEETVWLDTLSKNPQSWMARNNLGGYYERHGLLEQAVGEFREAIRIKPDHVRAYHNLGTTFVALERMEDAADAFRQAVRLNPSGAEDHCNLGRTLVALGQTDEAAREYLEAVRLKSDYAEALNNLGILVAGKGRTEEAAGYFRRAVAINPDIAEAQRNLGKALVVLGQTDEAVRHYDEALRIKPDYAEAHFDLAVILTEQGKTDEAVGHYREGLRLQPEQADAHYNLANALVAQGHAEEAIGHYREALRINPGLIEAHNNLGLALMKAGRPQEAVDEYRKMLFALPDHPKAHYNLGLALASLGRKDEAAAEYREAIRIRPDYAAPHNNLGNILAAQGHVDEAIIHFLVAIRIDPGVAHVHNNLGSAYLASGRPEAAAAEFREALRLNPSYVEARANLQAALAEIERRGRQPPQ